MDSKGRQELIDPMEQLKKQMRITYDLLGDKEMAKSVATMYFNIFEALKEKGFTKEEALQLTTHFGSKMK